ncbi:unnamed protein product [Orchesella dallaii]|uniref:Uncharacterized protein n=1 Tax=Orchesella dallaii TaxID=48710 RepID=A0ABP1S7P3_9HEXA
MCNIPIGGIKFRFPYFELGAYPFKDHAVNCSLDEKTCRHKMLSLYKEKTGDGNNITYCIMPVIGITESKKLELILRSNNPRKILNAKAKLDDILLTVFTEGIFQKGGDVRFGRMCMLLPWIIAMDGLPSDLSVIPVDTTSYNFLTCDGAQTSVNFLSYLIPFQLPVWSMLILSIGITVIVMLVLKSFFVTLGNTSELSTVSIILTITAFLLDTEVNVGAMTSRTRSFRGFLAIWGYAALILNTAYRGDNFANFIAPIDDYSMWSKFTDLKNFTLITPASRLNDPKSQSSTFQFSLIKWLKNRMDDESYAKFYLVNWNQNIRYDGKILKNYSFQNSRDITFAQFFSNLKPVVLSKGRGADVKEVVEYVSNCKRTAFVADHTRINRLNQEVRESEEKWNLTGAGKRIYSGNDKLFNEFRVWGSTKSSGSYLIRRMGYFMGSGIYQFWSQFYKKGSTSKMQQQSHALSENVALSLHSNLVTIFYIFNVCCIISFAVFGIEVIRKWSGTRNISNINYSEEQNLVVINVRSGGIL